MSIRPNSPERVKAPHLPRESTSICSKCCACRRKVDGDQRRPSAPQQSPESYSVGPATQKYIHVLEVLRLPHKTSRGPAAIKRARLLVQDIPEQAILVGKLV